MISPVIGYSTSNVLPVSTYLPLMKFGSCRTPICLGTLEPVFSVLSVLLLGRRLGHGVVAGGLVRLGYLADDDRTGSFSATSVSTTASVSVLISARNF